MVEDKTWDKLREMRIKAGKTVPEVSKYLQSIGLKAATQTIYGWERGHSQPTIDTFIEMCRFYGVSDVFSYFGDVPEISDVISISEREHIKKYRLLDPYGKEAVDCVLDVESRRCREERDKQATILREQREQTEAAEEIAPPITLHQPYAQVAAAEGAGAFLLDDGFDEVFVEMNKYTKQADVILKVVGRSMEPVITDGDRVLVRQQPSVRIGEIGVFIVDGQGYLKEYQADRLVSLNPDIDDVLVGDLQNAECYGKFIKVLNPDWVK